MGSLSIERAGIGSAVNDTTRELGPNSPAFLGQVNDAFLSGLGVACFVAAGVALAGGLVASRFLPACAGS